MAIARPIRLLAIVTFGLFCFVLIVLFQGPAVLKPPSDENTKLEKWDKDPNLERVYYNPSIYHSFLTSLATDEPAEPTAITMLPITQIRTG